MSQILITSGTSWTVPADWDNLNNYIEAIGSGGNGGAGNPSDLYGAGGGGGGAYASIRSLALTPLSSVPITIGFAGTSPPYTGTPTQFLNNTTLVADSASTAIYPYILGGSPGGQASNSVGSVTYSGGDGGPGSQGNVPGGGGGGAASRSGPGLAGGTATLTVSGNGGASGSGLAGAASVTSGSGIAGSSGTEYGAIGSGSGGSGAVSSPGLGGAGGQYGGGGGGTTQFYSSVGGLAGGGLIVITYAPPPTISVTTLANATPCGGAASVLLSWSGVSDADSYNVYRSTISGSGYVLMGNTSSLSYTDTPPSPANAYYYVVTSVLAGLSSAYSNQVAANVLANAVTPFITSNAISYFNSGAPYSPGMYCITYLVGAYGLGQNGLWTINQDIDRGNGGVSLAYKITDGFATIDGPGNYDSYGSQAGCQSANVAKVVYFYHAYSTPIGMYLNDSNYVDNIAGSPNPTFLICGPWAFGGLSASLNNVLPGTSVSLNWNIVGTSDTQVLDNGIGAISGASGSVSVSPEVTTTYTMTLTRFGVVFTTQVTVVITTPTAPLNLVAVGGVSGVVELSWTAASNITVHHVYRGTSQGGPFTLVGSPAGATWTDAVPIPGSIYYYYVAGYDGLVEGKASAVASGASILAPPTPSGVSATAGPVGGQITLTWTVPSGSYGDLTYSVYRGVVAGGEGGSAILAGVAGPSVVDGTCVNGLAYFYVLTAGNVAGVSGQSAEVSATAQDGIGGQLWVSPAAAGTGFSNGVGV